MSEKISLMPKEFFWRRFHSLMGLWLVLFLIQHLLTNSQAALVFGEDGGGFVKAVNSIKSLPFLQAIEISLLGIPFFIHMAWGIKYLFMSEPNSFSSDGTKPSLPQYPRNRAFTWQRITSWILLFAVIAHVVHMRFIEYPLSAKIGAQKYYMLKVSEDPGLYSLAERLNAEIYDQRQIKGLKNFVQKINLPDSTEESEIKSEGSRLLAKQRVNQQNHFFEKLEQRQLKPGEVIALTKDFGTAELLLVRDTFKSPLMILLYTIFVLAAVFHAFNGFWTFLITWGITLTERSQVIMRKFAVLMMMGVGFLGLMAIWGTYWINLRV